MSNESVTVKFYPEELEEVLYLVDEALKEEVYNAGRRSLLTSIRKFLGSRLDWLVQAKNRGG